MPNYNRKLNPQQEKEVIRLYKAGKSTVTIGKEYGTHHSTIRNLLIRHGIDTSNMERYFRVFSDEQESEITKLYKLGWSAKAISKMYAVDHGTIIRALVRQGIEQRAVPERNRLYQLNPHAFDSIDNEHAAYWLGFIYADGNTHNRSLNVTLKQSDGHHLEKLKTFLQSEAIIKSYLGNSSNGKKYPQANITITDRHLVEQLQALGISTGRPIPEHTFSQISDPLFHHWLRGFFDGDGSAHKSPAISFCGNFRLMELVRAKLANCIGSNPYLAISKHKTAQLYYLQYGGRLIALRVSDYLYQDATVWLERKRQVIASWPEPKERTRDSKGQYN